MLADSAVEWSNNLQLEIRISKQTSAPAPPSQRWRPAPFPPLRRPKSRHTETTSMLVPVRQAQINPALTCLREEYLILFVGLASPKTRMEIRGHGATRGSFMLGACSHGRGLSSRPSSAPPMSGAECSRCRLASGSNKAARGDVNEAYSYSLLSAGSEDRRRQHKFDRSKPLAYIDFDL